MKKTVCFGTTKMGERGQVVVPQELRDKLKTKTGEKFLVFHAPSGGIILIRPNIISKTLVRISEKIEHIKKSFPV